MGARDFYKEIKEAVTNADRDGLVDVTISRDPLLRKGCGVRVLVRDKGGLWSTSYFDIKDFECADENPLPKWIALAREGLRRRRVA